MDKNTEAQETQEAAGRVSAFLIRWSEMRGISQEFVHILDGGDYELKTQDLRTLLAEVGRIEWIGRIRQANAGLLERNGELVKALEGIANFSWSETGCADFEEAFDHCKEVARDALGSAT